MSQLLETIRIFDGKAENLAYHEARISSSQESLFGVRSLPDIESILEKKPPPKHGLFKARLIYEYDVYSLDYEVYKRREISKLAIRRMHTLSYSHKYADRAELNAISNNLGSRTEALIVIGDLITDTTFTNVAFKRGKLWITPEQPVLKGTMRAKLLDENKIIPKNIRAEDLKSFELVRLFNAMMPWIEAIEISIEKIIDEKN